MIPFPLAWLRANAFRRRVGHWMRQVFWGDVCAAPPVVNREQGKGNPCPNLLPRKIVFMSQSRKDPLKLSHLLRRKAHDKPVKKNVK